MDINDWIMESIDQDWMGVKGLFNFAVTFVIFEFFRRVVQVLLDWRRLRSEESLLVAVRNNLGHRFHVCLMGLVPALGVVCFLPSWVVVGGTDRWIVVVAFFIIYFVTHICGSHLSILERREMMEQSRHDMGPGLAIGFLSYLENALTDAKAVEKFNEYNEEDIAFPDSSKVGSFTPLILFPDLTDPFYLAHIQNYCLGLASGMIKRENDWRKNEMRMHEGDVLKLEDGAWYRYVDKAGIDRKSNYTVISMKEKDPRDGTDMTYYYFVCDNRPLLTIQMWYIDMLRRNMDVGPEELQRQLTSYKNCLIDLLETSTVCRGKYIALTVSGRLSDELRNISPLSSNRTLAA